MPSLLERVASSIYIVDSKFIIPQLRRILRHSPTGNSRRRVGLNGLSSPLTRLLTFICQKPRLWEDVADFTRRRRHHPSISQRSGRPRPDHSGKFQVLLVETIAVANDHWIRLGFTIRSRPFTVRGIDSGVRRSIRFKGLVDQYGRFWVHEVCIPQL